MPEELRAKQSAADRREIRVFISSTFRDMQGERDELVKHVFPQLRRLCESRNVTWGEVDLRWGVPDEAKAEGKVLPLCLQEIEKCRPYFIGVLGERYGWVPEHIPESLFETQPWLREHLDHSVTALEILHGVLRSPDMEKHAFFYFRDPAYAATYPGFTEENAARREKLAKLKDDIRQSRFPVSEPFATPKQLGEWVLRDLTAVIERLYPIEEVPNALDRDAFDHEAHSASRRIVYIGRQENMDRLDAHAAGDGLPLVIAGESGGGKSALLANWTHSWSEQHPETPVLIHFIGASPDAANWMAMLRRLIGEFQRKFDIQIEIPDQPDALRTSFATALNMVAARGRLVLALDALNQIEDRDGAPDLVWLPPVIPANVRLIVSALPGRPWNDLKKRSWPVLTVEPLTAAERKELIQKYLKRHSKELSPRPAHRIAASPQTGNGLYLSTLLNELRLLGSHEELEERIDWYLQAADPFELYRKVIQRWEQDYEERSPGMEDLVGESLTRIWAARRGLSESELLESLGTDGKPLPRAFWTPLYLATGDTLVNSGGLLTFAHEYLREAVRHAYLPTKSHERSAHRTLAEYFHRQSRSPNESSMSSSRWQVAACDSAHHPPPSPSQLDELAWRRQRQLDELAWQWQESAEWKQLAALLGDPDFLEEARSTKQYELQAYWVNVELNSTYRLLDVYGPILTSPESHGRHAIRVTELLFNLGYQDKAEGALDRLLSAYRMQAKPVTDQLREIGMSGVQEQLIGQMIESTMDALPGDDPLDTVPVDREAAAAVCRMIVEKFGYRLKNFDSVTILCELLALWAATLERKGNLKGAIEALKEQAELYLLLEDTTGWELEMGRQAELYSKLGFKSAARAIRDTVRLLSPKENDALKSKSTIESEQSREQADRLHGIELLNRSEYVARTSEDVGFLVETLRARSSFLLRQGNLENALEVIGQAESVCREQGFPAGLPHILSERAAILRRIGQPEEALAILLDVERLARQFGDTKLATQTLISRALAYKDLSETEKAQASLQEYVRISKEQANYDEAVSGLVILAHSLRTHGNAVLALSTIREAEGLSRDKSMFEKLSLCLSVQTSMLIESNDLSQALMINREVETIARDLGYRERLQKSLGYRSIIMQRTNDLRGALAAAQEQEHLCRQLDLFEELAASLTNQAMFHYQMNDRSQARVKMEQAFSTVEEHGIGKHASDLKLRLNELQHGLLPWWKRLM